EVYRGRDAVLRQFRQFVASFSEYRIEIEDLFGADDKVAAVCHEIGRGKASGAPVDRRVGWIFTYRAGKLLRMEIYLDPADALEAVGVRRYSAVKATLYVVPGSHPSMAGRLMLEHK